MYRHASDPVKPACIWSGMYRHASDQVCTAMHLIRYVPAYIWSGMYRHASDPVYTGIHLFPSSLPSPYSADCYTTYWHCQTADCCWPTAELAPCSCCCDLGFTNCGLRHCALCTAHGQWCAYCLRHFCGSWVDTAACCKHHNAIEAKNQIHLVSVDRKTFSEFCRLLYRRLSNRIKWNML